jgi:hypothetical protein
LTTLRESFHSAEKKSEFRQKECSRLEIHTTAIPQSTSTAFYFFIPLTSLQGEHLSIQHALLTTQNVQINKYLKALCFTFHIHARSIATYSLSLMMGDVYGRVGLEWLL